MAQRLMFAAIVLVLAASSWAQQPSPASPAGAENVNPGVVGWRGNWTGRFPDSTAPLTWSRKAKGIATELLCQGTKPNDKSKSDGAKPVTYGYITEWMFAGPVVAQEASVEAAFEPDANAKVADVAWKPLTAVDPVYASNCKGNTQKIDPSWVDSRASTVAGKVTYVHTYLFSPQAGKASLILDHNTGIDVMVNGKAAYANPKAAMGFGYRHNVSEQKMAGNDPKSPRFDIELGKGWNRLLFKVQSSGGVFNLRVIDLPESIKYEDKNIVWASLMPGYTVSNPVVVGDRIFTLAEPDVLVCVNKADGKILWTRTNSYYDALTDKERDNEIVKTQVKPLAEKLAKEKDYDACQALRREIRGLMAKVDKDKYEIRSTGHYSVHYDIAGWSGETPCSDGKYIYVNFIHGVAACYDLDGKRQWIQYVRPQVPPGATGHAAEERFSYPTSPLLIDGKFIIAANHLKALDAKTGQIVWEQPKVGGGVALTAAKFGGELVVVSGGSHVTRVKDGKVMWIHEGRLPKGGTSDYGWAPPIIEGTTSYLPWYGASAVEALDFSKVSGDEFKPASLWRVDSLGSYDGKWREVQSGAAPLYHNGLLYLVNMYADLVIVDANTHKRVLLQKLDCDPMIHCNAVGMGACPTLIGKNIVLMDNLGTSIVIEPGSAFKPVGKNRIESIVQRRLPICTQEVTYANPIVDGKYIFIRGEENLYCVGAK